MPATIYSRPFHRLVLFLKTKILRYGELILLLVLYGCDAWCLMLTKVYRLEIFENDKKGFWPKKEQVTEGWRKLHNEELRDFYSLNNDTVRLIGSRVMRWTVHVENIGEQRMHTGV